MIYATNNAKKIKELTTWSPVPLISYQDYLKQPIKIEETGQTYEENARLKALEIARHLNQPVLGDDGGLELEDFPHLLGINTSRFFESNMNDQEMNEQILELFNSQYSYSRKATLVACLVYALPDGRTITAESRLPFIVANKQCGKNGYGFDSILIVPELGVTVAELSVEERMRYSARQQAFRQLLNQLKGQMNDHH